MKASGSHKPTPLGEAHLEAAMTHHRMGRLAAAVTAYRAALAETPEHPDALHLLGVALHQSGQPRAGLALIARVLARDPAFPQALANAALILQALGRPADAVVYARAALILHPAYAEAWTNLGNIEKDRNRLEAADACHCRALAIRPAYGEAMTNRGTVQELLGRPGIAAALHRAALTLRPDLADAHNNLGIALQALGKREAAAASFVRALNLQADLPLAQWNLGLLRLAAGKLAAGWQGYRWRFRGPQMLKARHFPVPEWRGEPLAGRRLLVWREQGVGDEVLFATLWPELLARVAAEGGAVILETEPRLVSLFQRRFPAATVRPAPDPAVVSGLAPEEPAAAERLDFQIPAGSLPALLRPSLDHFPPRLEGLIPCPDRVALWRQRLDALPPGLRIGLCWRSRDLAARRSRSYTSLRDWQPLLTRPGVQIIRLQYDDCAAEIADAEARFGITLHQWADLDLKDDFEGVAALMVNLDLVITGPTSVGELAAALGAPVWRLAWYGDWSALGAAARPWYPSMRLFTGLADDALPETLAVLLRALDVLERRARRGRPAASSPPCDLRQAGLAALAAGRSGPAAEALARAAGEAPHDPVIRNAWGVALQRLGQPAAALAQYQAALRLAPMAADSRVNLATLAQEHDQPVAAEACLRQAIALDPALDAAFSNLGLALSRRGALADAETAYRCALRLHPQQDESQAALRLGLAAVWRRQARFQEAAAALAPLLAPPAVGSLAISPPLAPETVARAWSDLALIHQRQGRFGAAEQALAEALALVPELASARWLRSQLRLQRGDLRGGWADAVWRFAADRRAALSPAATRLPEWEGESLAGRRLLVWREQGVGDELLLATLYPQLLVRAAAEGGAVTLTCDPRLVTLFRRSFPAATVQPQDARTWPAGVDCQIAAGSLSRLLRPDLAAFPAVPGLAAFPAAPGLAAFPAVPGHGAPVLRADPVRQAAWAQRLAALEPAAGPPRLRVGLAWRSGVLDPERAGSYTGLSQWHPVLRQPGIQVIPLQYQADPQEIAAVAAAFGLQLPGWPDLDLKNDFEAVAALMTHLDLMLCGPTAAGELAAGLGVPVWRLSWRGDWTTLGSRQRPWFPSLRSFLAGEGETLDDQIMAVAARLRSLERRAMAGPPRPAVAGSEAVLP